MLGEDRELAARAAQIETLLDEVASFPDPAVRARMVKIVQGLVAFYGTGLARMLAIVRERGDGTGSAALLQAFSADELIAHLLLLHDLHPVDVETRVSRALDEVRPYLHSHGGDVELIGIVGSVVRLRLQGSCNGCPSSTVTLKVAIEEAIQKAAPDLDGIETEVVADPPQARLAGFVPITTLRRKEKMTHDV